MLRIGVAGVAARIGQNSDVVVAAAVILMVIMMVIPLPAGILDVLLVFNLTLALLVVLTAMYSAEPLDFSVFPSLLLLATLFRLSLNVSSTRLILLDGYAGEVIRQFGCFVIRGNPLVGLVIFLILVVIQFMVITRGAERVAEVAARFTLDAMPGKQMSIDADLNSGLIDEEGARQRRRDIEREADFYGAMDGASKFVKGDAIAAVVITLINLIGGLITGVLQRGMPIGEAASTYSLLTVGDGLVSQIPALLLSIATGLAVTRAATDNVLGQELSLQVASQPRVVGIAAAAIGGMGLIPGLPTIPFLILSGLLAVWGFQLTRRTSTIEDTEQENEEDEGPHDPESVLPFLSVEPLELELGLGLLQLTQEGEQGDLLDRIAALRRQLALELGLVVPLVRVRDNLSLRPDEYRIRLFGVPVASGNLRADKLLAMGPEDAELEGQVTEEPAFGLPAYWIDPDQRLQAEVKGFTVVEPAAVLTTHLSELLKNSAAELMTRQQTHQLLELLKEEAPDMVSELVPDTVSVGQLQHVLQNLLDEGVPIRNLGAILETLGEAASVTQDPDIMTEYARQALKRQISHLLPVDSGTLNVITLDPNLEESLRTALQRDEGRLRLNVAPRLVAKILRSLEAQVNRAYAQGAEPVLLCPPVVRLKLKELVGPKFSRLPVVSYNELLEGLEIQAIGMVTVDHVD